MYTFQAPTAFLADIVADITVAQRPLNDAELRMDRQRYIGKEAQQLRWGCRRRDALYAS